MSEHPPADAIRLGPFRLIEPIGTGGMAEVWRAVHEPQGLEAAVKVITAQKALEDNYRAAFTGEVRAVARLDHPGVVMVFDYGEVTVDAAMLSGGRLRQGSPYLVMELVGGGSLRELGALSDWLALRAVLIELLEVLSHAHARRVIHRDIKAANVLLPEGASRDNLLGLKLSDFGIAHATEVWHSELLDDRPSGTPNYMAPEQIEGRFRDQGPWTDLYGLGCLTYRLASGRPPFHTPGAGPEQILRRQMMKPPPPLTPLFPVPDGLPVWLDRLLAKRPADRYLRAADALADLLELGEAPGGAVEVHAPVHVDEPGDDEPTRPFVPEDATRAVPNIRRVATIDDADYTPRRKKRLSAPELPRTWRRRDRERPSMQLVGAGLGLYELRTIPLIGREPARDQLWEMLASVRRNGQPHAAVLHGPAGVGKSRLAEWFAERAHEVGSATILHATHSPIGGPADGLPAMLAEFLRCVGLGPEDVLERTRDVVDWWAVEGDPVQDPDALAALMLPDGHEVAPIRFSRPEERFVAIHRYLARLGLERPVIVWLDDVQWGIDALRFARYVLTQKRPAPVLFVLTARDDELAARRLEGQLVTQILEHPSAEMIEVLPLDEGDHTQLVEALIGLEGELARDVSTRTAGNPLFAVTLVGDWIRRGILEVGHDGFVLEEDAEAPIPDDLHALWQQRLKSLVAGIDNPDRAGEILELAAALGSRFHAREWATVVQLSGCEQGLADLVLHRTARSHLVTSTDNGWAFTHGMIRESLERRAEEADRRRKHHRTCAAMLRHLYGPGAVEVAERLGRHLLLGGDLRGALDPLYAGAEQRAQSGDFLVASSLLGEHERALKALGVSTDDKRRVAHDLLDAELLLKRGMAQQAEESLGRVEPAIVATTADQRSDDAPELVARLRRLQGIAASMTGDGVVAELRFSQAAELFAVANDPIGQGHAVYGIGVQCRVRGEVQQAIVHQERATELFESRQDQAGLSRSLLELGNAYQRQGDWVLATRYIRRAAVACEATRNRAGAAYCLSALGTAARHQGDLDQADALYARAADLLTAVGSADTVLIHMNRGLVMLARADYLTAAALFESALKTILASGRRSYLAELHAYLLASRAGAGDFRQWNHHYRELLWCLSETGVVEPDIAWAAELAGDLAWQANDPVRAVQAFELALKQRRELGHREAIDALRKRLEQVNRGG